MCELEAESLQVALYRILQSTDWSFLIGAEVGQIAIGSHQVQIALLSGGTISIEADFVHARSGKVLSEGTSIPERAATLVTLLGKLIKSVDADGENALSLSFSGDETLKILVDDSPYEAFQISRPEGLIVV